MTKKNKNLWHTLRNTVRTNWSFVGFRCIDNYRFIHSIKTAIAIIIGLSIFYYFDLPMGQWIPITIMVVMSAQTSFGAILEKSYMRFLGTFAGVTTVVLTLLLFNHDTSVIFIVVFLSCLIFTYIASRTDNISYAGTLGGVTVILTLTGTSSTVEFAIVRGLYIVIGIIIAVLVSRLIYPVHARDRLKSNIANTLRNLQKLYFITIQTNLNPVLQISQMSTNEHVSEINTRKLDKIIMKDLALQPKLIHEASTGSLDFAKHKKQHFLDIVSCERKIYRLIYFMQKSIAECADMPNILNNISALENLHIAIEHSLDSLANHLEHNSQDKAELEINIKELPEKIKFIMQSLPSENDVQKLLSEHSFLFLLEQIIKEINILFLHC